MPTLLLSQMSVRNTGKYIPLLDKVDSVEHGRGKRSRESVDYAMFDNEKEDREKDDDKFEASVRAMVDKQESGHFIAFNGLGGSTFMLLLL